jgi:hypothetical protein
MAKFITRLKNYRLVIEPAAREVVNGRPVIHYGKSIRFEDGYYETKDKSEIEFLKNHSDLNRLFYEEKEKEKAMT